MRILPPKPHLLLPFIGVPGEEGGREGGIEGGRD